MNNVNDLSRDKGVSRSDSSTGLTERELEQVEAQILEPREEEMIAPMVFTQNTNAPAWIKSVTYDKVIDRYYRELEDTNNAEFDSTGGTEFQIVDQNVQRRSNLVFKRFLGARLPWDEVEASRAQNRDIESSATSNLRKANNRFRERLSFLGSKKYEIPGAATATGITSITGNDWTSSSTGGDKILADVDDMIESLLSEPGFSGPFEIVLARKAYSQLATRRVAPGQGDTRTILEIVEMNPMVANVRATMYLDEVELFDGTDEGACGLAVASEPEHVDLLVPEPMMMRDPMRQKDDSILLRTLQSIGGLRIKDEKAIVKITGLDS